MANCHNRRKRLVSHEKNLLPTLESKRNPQCNKGGSFQSSCGCIEEEAVMLPDMTYWRNKIICSGKNAVICILCEHFEDGDSWHLEVDIRSPGRSKLKEKWVRCFFLDGK